MTGNIDLDKVCCEFEQVLQSNREEDVQSFLKRNSFVVLNAFGDCWVVNECIPKFKFGNEHVSDFVVVSGQSGRYDVTLVELEPPTERPFTKKGSYAKRLNGALAQVSDWLGWIHDNEQYFRKSLAAVVTNRYGAGQVANSRRLFLRAKIVIGRRSMFSEADNKKRSTLFDQHQGKLEIVPYDRLLERVVTGSENI